MQRAEAMSSCQPRQLQPAVPTQCQLTPCSSKRAAPPCSRGSGSLCTRTWSSRCRTARPGASACSHRSASIRRCPSCRAGGGQRGRRSGRVRQPASRTAAAIVAMSRVKQSRQPTPSRSAHRLVECRHKLLPLAQNHSARTQNPSAPGCQPGAPTQAIMCPHQMTDVSSGISERRQRRCKFRQRAKNGRSGE